MALSDKSRVFTMLSSSKHHTSQKFTSKRPDVDGAACGFASNDKYSKRATSTEQGPSKGISRVENFPLSLTHIKGRRLQHERVVLSQYEELVYGPYRSPQLQLCSLGLWFWLWWWTRIAALSCFGSRRPSITGSSSGLEVWYLWR